MFRNLKFTFSILAEWIASNKQVESKHLSLSFQTLCFIPLSFYIFSSEFFGGSNPALTIRIFEAVAKNAGLFSYIFPACVHSGKTQSSTHMCFVHVMHGGKNSYETIRRPRGTDRIKLIVNKSRDRIRSDVRATDRHVLKQMRVLQVEVGLHRTDQISS